MGALQTRWQRCELKYVITESQASRIARYIQPFIARDPHATRGGYPVVSLYLDSADLRLCRESLDGAKNRFKLRIRSYTDAPEAPCSVEIKRRMNRIIAKSRAWLSRGDAATLMETVRPCVEQDEEQAANLAQFAYYQAQLRATPVLRVRYKREAYESAFGSAVRITFDRELAFNMTTTANFGMNGSGWQSLPRAPVVLEIKFTACFPAWLRRLVLELEIQERSFSKYALSVRHACEQGFNAPRRQGGFLE